MGTVSQFQVINQLRLPLIILVTYAHSYNEVAEGYSLLGSGWDTYQVLKLVVSQTLVKAAMPMFFFISGYLFFVNVEKWDWQTYQQKIKRRIKTLLIPYIIWNLLMAVKLRTFSPSIFWEPANMPLWFLRDLIVVSLLTPIIYIGVRKLGSWLMAILTIIYLSGICAFIPGLSAYAVYFFTFGAFFSIRRMDLLENLRPFEWPAYIISIAFAIAMMLTYNMPVFSSLMLCFRLAGAVAVFCLASRILSTTARRLPSVVCDSAYLVYLAHYVFFFSFIDTAFFAAFGTSTTALSLHYLLAPLLKAAVFIAVYAAYRRIFHR